ncbi:MAG: hypothetical protein ABIR51_06075 [Sphingomicrobium sp.]
MSHYRSASPVPVHRFGRRRPFTMAMEAPPSASILSDDVKLFAMTFVGGLMFMTVYLA